MDALYDRARAISLCPLIVHLHGMDTGQECGAQLPGQPTLQTQEFLASSRSRVPVQSIN